MKTSQATLNSKVEYCEYSEPLDNIWRCKLTDFGYVWRCLKTEKESCPDLEYFLEEKQRSKKK